MVRVNALPSISLLAYAWAMNQTRFRLLCGLLVVGGVIILSVSPASAQFAARVFEVTGIGGREVETVVNNSIALSESSSNAIRTPINCRAGATRRTQVPTSLTAIPPRFPDGGSETGINRWNRLTLTNVHTVMDIVCQRADADAGVGPDCSTPGWGDTLGASGGFVQYSTTENEPVTCRACTNTSDMEVVTELCDP